MQKPNLIKRMLKFVIFRMYYYVTLIPIPFPRRLAWGDWWLSWDDHIGRLIRTNSFENAETELLTKILKPGMVMIDAGAHRGYYTLLASSILGKNGKVISFEPSPRERQWLWIHLLVNRRKNVRIEKSALGSKEEIAEFYITIGKQTGCNSLQYPKGVLYSLPIRVPVITLDNYYHRSGMDNLDFIKIDVEGAEKDLLIGGGSCLREARPVIICELSDLRTLRWNYRPMEIVTILESLDYLCFFIRSGCHLEPYREKSTYEDNILAVPKEKRTDFEGMI